MILMLEQLLSVSMEILITIKFNMLNCVLMKILDVNSLPQI